MNVYHPKIHARSAFHKTYANYLLCMMCRWPTIDMNRRGNCVGGLKYRIQICYKCGRYCSMAFSDSFKAFDCVDHKILLRKLNITSITVHLWTDLLVCCQIRHNSLKEWIENQKWMLCHLVFPRDQSCVM